MNIKILSVAVITSVGLLIYKGLDSSSEKISEASYIPRTEQNDDFSAKGAEEYWKKIRGSLKDGEIHPEDYNSVLAEIENKKASRAEGLGLELEPIGPTNIGGRTRSLVVDVDDPNVVYAAGVSGGIYKSLNGGNTWTTSYGQDTIMTNSWMAQGSDGVLYLATGASPFELAGGSENGNSAPKEPGKGILKSTDRGETWSFIKSTAVNNNDRRFEHISEIDISPINPKIIAVASLRGLFVSFDGGENWVDDLLCNTGVGTPLVGDINSIEFSLDGKILWAGTDDGRFYHLNDISETNSCGFEQTLATEGWVLGSRRMKLSASVINPKKIYAALTDAGDVLIDIVESSDGGITFESINPNVPYSNPNFDIFGSGQAWYDLLFKVTPNIKDTSRENIWLGGVALWRYDGNWTQAAVGGRANGMHNPFFVHVDHHIMTYHKKNPNLLFFGNDGGVFKSLDGGYEFFDINKGYMTTQFYSIDIANFDYAIGGTQDNGCIIVSPLRPGDSDFGAVVTNENITNGDGFDCLVSNIADIKYTSAQYNNVGRGLIVDVKGGGSCGKYCDDQGNFYTKLALWESLDDKTSKEYIEFKVDTQAQVIDLGTGIRKTFSGTIIPTQSAAEVDFSSLEIGTIDIRLTYNGQGGFTGDGKGTLDENTLEFSVTFDNPPSLNSKVNAYYASKYSAGSVLDLLSNTAQIPIKYMLSTNLEPGDAEFIQDPVQSMIAMSTSRECLDAQSHLERNCTGRSNGILVSRNAINSTVEINWLFLPVNSTAYRMVFSPDGDKLFASSGTRINRVNGLNDVYTQADADAITTTTITGFPSTVTGISIHPNDPETLIVTTGNYGSTGDHVFIVTNALTGVPTVKAVGGDLPKFPVYDAIFDVTDPSKVVLGTDKGVWTCNDIWAANPTYIQENSSFGRYPVIDVDQQTLPPELASNSQQIYFGTHGAGIWKTGSLVSSLAPELEDEKVWETKIRTFPNPATSNIQIEYNVQNTEKIQMQVYSIGGNVVKTINPTVNQGKNSINVPINDLPSGAYIINLIDGNRQSSSKFIKL